jgi:uncharacterized protein
VFDTAPLSLLTTRSIEGLGALVEPALEPLRFRPNLLVETGRVALGDAVFIAL